KKEEAKTDPGKDEVALLTDKYLRICAEYDNFRKRTQKEKENLYGDIRANVISSFLPVYDNLVRALAAETQDEAYRKGVEMIMNQFNSTLEKLGASEIKAVGEKFDPALHNAVMHVDDETKGENEIVEEFQKGFKIGDKVIRFSMVKVAN
ncbi:MAG: nucleotide exchange factor GrpE, partial [Oscillospiraceae bacterium]|nr:nucleotide exchange factor GrpE [Oscillospiraceae bacterium]